METPEFKPKNEVLNEDQIKEQILKFFSENEIDKLTFDTKEEAKTHVDMINAKYGDISFVAEDRGGFTVKFRASHLGEGFLEHKDDQDLEREAA